MRLKELISDPVGAISQHIARVEDAMLGGDKMTAIHEAIKLKGEIEWLIEKIRATDAEVDILHGQE